ncbi:unnamed protein product, partial [Allacma fusca]
LEGGYKVSVSCRIWEHWA